MKKLLTLALSISLLAGTAMILPAAADAMGKKEEKIACACGSGKPASECCAKKAGDALKSAKCACGSGKPASECCAK